MKSALKIIGIALVVIGSLFKIQHWPGATISILSGLVLYCTSLFARNSNNQGELSDIIDAPNLTEPQQKKNFYLKEVGLTTICIGLYLRYYNFQFSFLVLSTGILLLIIHQIIRK